MIRSWSGSRVTNCRRVFGDLPDHGVITITVRHPQMSDEVGIRDLFVNFFASAKKAKGRETLENMEGEEERGIVGEENSQKDVVTDETSRQEECSQTPQLGSDRGSDDDDHREERGWSNLMRCGKLWSTSRRGRLTVWWWIRNTVLCQFGCHWFTYFPRPWGGEDANYVTYEQVSDGIHAQRV